jgi:hypothetical protein
MHCKNLKTALQKIRFKKQSFPTLLNLLLEKLLLYFLKI